MLIFEENPIPRPLPHDQLVCDQSKQYPGGDACYPLDLSESKDWSLVSIFGHSLQGTCLGSQDEKIATPSLCLNVPHGLDVYTTGGIIEHKHPSGFSRCLTIPPTGDFELVVPKQESNKTSPIVVPPLYAERSITGHGQERGGVQALLTNPSQTSPVEFIYFEALPWFMKPFLHTLKAQVAGQASQSSSVIKDIYYRPGLDRKRGSQLELHIIVPPASTVVLSYQFEKAILRYTEYPPDANRGRDIAPAIIRLVSPDASTETNPTYLRTTSLMLPLPTPDFSMPYNVIILTSTVMALAFGMIYNLLVRRFVGTDEFEGKDLKMVIRGLVTRLKSRFKKTEAMKKMQ